MIRLVVADDQGMMRAGLRLLIEGEDDLTVVAEAVDGAEALDAIRRHDPDVALVDIRMPELDGIAVTRQLVAESTRTRILVMTTFDLDEYVFDALRAGASGFVLKDASADELLGAIRVLAGGDALLSPAVTRRVIERFATLPEPAPPPPSVEDLSTREIEVLELVAAGLTNAEIADRLVISTATVKTHVSSVLSKLGLRDRVHAVVAAYESGLVRPGDRS